MPNVLGFVLSISSKVFSIRSILQRKLITYFWYDGISRTVKKTKKIVHLYFYREFIVVDIQNSYIAAYNWYSNHQSH
jgi:hypothetical protein